MTLLRIFIIMIASCSIAFIGSAQELSTEASIEGTNKKVMTLYQQGLTLEATKLAENTANMAEIFIHTKTTATEISLKNLEAICLELGRYDTHIDIHINKKHPSLTVLKIDQNNTSAKLINMADLYKNTGRHNEAASLYRQIIETYLASITSFRNLAEIYVSEDDLSKALSARILALNTSEKFFGPNDTRTSFDLVELANIYRSLDKQNDAIPLYKRALQIYRKNLGNDHLATSTTINNLAGAYEELGNYTEALQLYQRALEIAQKILPKYNTEIGVYSNNIANIYKKLGNFNTALALYEQSLEISIKNHGENHMATAIVIINIAGIYAEIGQPEKSIRYMQNALAVTEGILGDQHSFTSGVLNALANMYRIANRGSDALPLYLRALHIRQNKIGENSISSATILNNIATLYGELGRNEEALDFFHRALKITTEEFGPDHPSVATILNNMAFLYEEIGQSNKSLALYRHSLQIVFSEKTTLKEEEKGSISALSTISANYANFIKKYQSEFSQDEAIFYYKISVNARQRMRSGTINMEKAMRDDFTKTVSDAYQELAKLLIQQGRLDEAERVLLMLKESDLYDFLRRSGSASDTSQEVLRWTADEDRLNQSLLKIARAWQTYNSDWHTLDEKQKRGEIKDDAPEFAQLAAQRQQIETQTDNQLNDALERFRDGLREMALNNQKSFEIARTTLAQKLSDIQQLSGAPSPRTAGLVLLPGKRGLTMVVTTELGAVPLMVPVDEDTLVKLVQEMREALRTRGDYQTAAKALHQYLIAPAEQQLGQQAAIQQWAILPYGALRNLPFATLMNATGQHLIERYALVTLTADGEGGFSGLDTAPKTEWRSAGFGASIADSAFNNVALPGVRTELCGIVSDPSEAAECQAQTSGVIPGRRYLNAHFTSAKLNLLMGPPTSTQAPSLLHIATHFSIDKSMLLLGDGGTLTLKTIGQWKPRLGHYDLVALSACDSGKTEAGVESLGGLFRKLGAKSVLATLWPLADVGAGPLMVEFYRQRGAQRVMAKSEALRRAQLAMLRGELKNPDNPATDLRHPYYWAGYVLMGNWL